MSGEMLPYLSESKRVDNRKMREELGVKLLYPTLESGLAASVPSRKQLDASRASMRRAVLRRAT
jgi:hypothetical protein